MEMRIVVKSGSVCVTHPSHELLRELAKFGSDGEYHELYSYSKYHDTLVTMPGFAGRILDGYGDDGYAVEDRRVPLPVPDIRKAMRIVEPEWRGIFTEMIYARGGFVAVPRIIGFCEVAASILAAYGQDGLTDRGTPISVVAVEEDAAGVCSELGRLLNGRDVSTSPSGDDIIVSRYSDLQNVPRNYTGILIADDALGCVDPSRAEGLSSFREAARWGVQVSLTGGIEGPPLEVEGMFGKASASITYEDAVTAGIGVPVTVCWLKSPKPYGPSMSASLRSMATISMQGNEKFVSMVSDIMKRVNPDVGCVLCTNVGLAKKVSSVVGKSAPTLLVQPKKWNAVLSDIERGEIRKAIVTPECITDVPVPHGVMILSTCSGRDMNELRFPWRRPAVAGDKSYLVDFSHDWDLHNGRPGMLARNDKARSALYTELGFRQIYVQDIEHLPFL